MNCKSFEEQMVILKCLMEGISIRGASRITGAARNTISKLIVDVGLACIQYQRQTLQNLTCKRIQADELWCVLYAKSKNVPSHMVGKAGSLWTWIAMDADTKFIPYWHLGSREAVDAGQFMNGVAGCLANRPQLTTDGYRSYPDAVENAFGPDIDYAMTIKSYDETSIPSGTKTGVYKHSVMGNPDLAHASTAFIERLNLTVRMCVRRYTRKTNAFSKKLENHRCMFALFVTYYNFIRIHQTLRVTPAMEAGISKTLWQWQDVLRLTFPDRV